MRRSMFCLKGTANGFSKKVRNNILNNYPDWFVFTWGENIIWFYDI